MNILIESMHNIGLCWYNIRIWRQEGEDWDGADLTAITEKLIEEIKLLMASNPTLVQLARRIANIDKVNAVEVLDVNGNGTVIYSSWP